MEMGRGAVWGEFVLEGVVVGVKGVALVAEIGGLLVLERAQGWTWRSILTAIVDFVFKSWFLKLVRQSRRWFRSLGRTRKVDFENKSWNLIGTGTLNI
jgi:hypothetical protein